MKSTRPIECINIQLKIAFTAWIFCLTTVHATVVVNSLEDIAAPPAGTVTLRSALARAASNESITFASGLDAGVITLSIVAEEHTELIGEVMGIDVEESTIVLHWSGNPSRSYTLWAATSLTAADWNPIKSGITSNIPVLVHPAQAPQEGQFFKLEMDPLD